MHRKTSQSEFLFNKVADLQLYQKETTAQTFPVNIAEFSRTPNLRNIYERFQNFFLQRSLLMAVKFSVLTCSEVLFLRQETITESYSELCKISKMNCSVKIVNSLRCLRFLGKALSQMYEGVLQKQPPKCSSTRCSQKFCKIHRKTPVSLCQRHFFPVNFAKFLKFPTSYGAESASV